MSKIRVLDMKIIGKNKPKPVPIKILQVYKLAISPWSIVGCVVSQVIIDRMA